MITEYEARKKWCPFARLNSGANRSLHGIYRIADGTNCIASDCIHWVEIVNGFGYPGCSPFWAKMAEKYYAENKAGEP